MAPRNVMQRKRRMTGNIEYPAHCAPPCIHTYRGAGTIWLTNFPLQRKE